MCKEPTHVPQNCTREVGELRSVFRQPGCPIPAVFPRLQTGCRPGGRLFKKKKNTGLDCFTKAGILKTPSPCLNLPALPR